MVRDFAIDLYYNEGQSLYGKVDIQGLYNQRIKEVSHYSGTLISIKTTEDEYITHKKYYLLFENLRNNLILMAEDNKIYGVNKVQELEEDFKKKFRAVSLKKARTYYEVVTAEKLKVLYRLAYSRMVVVARGKPYSFDKEEFLGLEHKKLNKYRIVVHNLCFCVYNMRYSEVLKLDEIGVKDIERIDNEGIYKITLNDDTILTAEYNR